MIEDIDDMQKIKICGAYKYIVMIVVVGRWIAFSSREAENLRQLFVGGVYDAPFALHSGRGDDMFGDR